MLEVMLMRTLATILILLALVSTNGCLCVSALTRLGADGTPRQEASIGELSQTPAGPLGSRVIVRADDGRESRTWVALAPTRDAGATLAVERHFEGDMIDPIHVFGPASWSYEVTATAGDSSRRVGEVEPIRDEASTAAKIAEAVLMPFAVLIDLATFPIEWPIVLIIY